MGKCLKASSGIFYSIFKPKAVWVRYQSIFLWYSVNVCGEPETKAVEEEDDF